MGHPFFFIYILSLVIAASALVTSFWLKSRYPWPPLSDWFYYLLFFYLMVIANTTMVQLAWEVLPLDLAGQEKVLHLMHTFLAQPCFVISLYMFIRFALILARRDLPRHFAPAYFGFWGLFFAVTLALTLQYFNTGNQLLLRSIYDYADLAVSAAWLLIGLCLVYRAKSLQDKEEALVVSRFGWLFTISLGLYDVSLILPFNPAVQLTARFLYNLPPLVLLVWHVSRRSHPEMTEVCISDMADQVFSQHNVTEREREVVRLLCQGKSNKEIGNALFISLQTVKHHIHSVYRKMGVGNRVQLANRIREASPGPISRQSGSNRS
jgi:DNA-binding CsgD family transcriptional regulator